MHFFLQRNLAIALDRAWTYTAESRGKRPDFWQLHVEEWDRSPQLDIEKPLVDHLLSTYFGRHIVKQVPLLPFSFYPIINLVLSGWLKALGTARHLHRRYFEAKKVTPQ